MITSGRLGGNGLYDLCISKNALSSIQSGYLKNIFIMSNITPTKMSVLDDYNISDIYMDSINNEEVYLICPSDDIYSIALNYYKSRSGKEIEFTLVKSYAGKNIYRVNTVGYDILSGININYNYEEWSGDIRLNVNDGIINLNGTLEDTSENIFAQDVYLEIVDSQSDSHKGYYVYQKYSKRDNNKLNSKVSFIGDIPYFYDDNDNIFLVIQNGEKIHRYKLDMTN